MNFYEFKELITDNYQLDPDVTEDLHFHFISYRGINRRSVYTTMSDNKTLENTRKTITTEDGEINTITLHDLQLTCFILVEQECSCDSNFMLRVMNGISATIQLQTPWIP
jgi:hypothetical protein